MVRVNRYSGSDLNRVKEFVSHLFENPSIKNEPALIGERFIINFIEKNSQELSVIFKSQDFFPNLDPGEVMDLILDDIYNRVSASSLPPINRFLDNSNLSFLDTLSETGVVDDMHRKRKLHDLALMLFGEREVRYRMYPVVALFRYNAVDRYISEIFSRQEYIYNGIANIDKIKPQADIYIRLIKVMLLLRNIKYLKMDKIPEGSPVSMTILESAMDKEKMNVINDVVTKPVISMLPGIPSLLIRLAIKSHLPCGRLDSDDALPKLIYIFCSMFQYYREMKKTYRGSESPEKSWLGTAKHNCSYAGYDRRMIDSLYNIAEDNNW